MRKIGIRQSRPALLSYLRAIAHRSRDGGYYKFAIGIYCRQNHTLRLNAHHLSWREIGNEQHLFAYQDLRIGITLRYTAQYSTTTHTVINAELQQTV